MRAMFVAVTRLPYLRSGCSGGAGACHARAAFFVFMRYVRGVCILQAALQAMQAKRDAVHVLRVPFPKCVTLATTLLGAGADACSGCGDRHFGVAGDTGAHGALSIHS